MAKMQLQSLSLHAWLVRLLPEKDERRMALAMLGYLLFLFVPLLWQWISGRPSTVPFDWRATLVSIAVFLPLYLRFWQRPTAWLAWAMGLLGLALVHWNVYANTYLIYAVIMLGLLPARLHRKLIQALLMLLLYGGIFYLFWPRTEVLLVMLITALIALAGLYGCHAQREREAQSAALRLSQEEVRRIAAVAERERIGRDLHDLLGHTLSMVALKAELASRLAGHDRVAAGQEMQEVARIAREALKEVRSAVTGIRSAVLAAELASARLLLEMQDIHLVAEIAPLALPSEIESALALSLREAATNVQRHAAARQWQVRLWQADGAVHLQLRDDGRGGARISGTGLAGMRERIERLGGQMQMDSPKGAGTRLHLQLPLPEAA